MHHLPSKTELGRLFVVEVYVYFDGPKLFACANTTGQKYLVFWLGEEDAAEKWLYVPLSETRLKHARSEGISLRDVCLSPEDGYIWVVDLPFNSDEPARVKAILPSELPQEDLPAEDSYLTLETTTLPTIEEPTHLRAAQTRCEVIDLMLEPEGERRSEVAARTLGAALVSIQEVLQSLLYSEEGYKSRKGRVPPRLLRKADLRVVGVFASSFGVRLESREQADLFGETALRPAIEDLVMLLNAGTDQDALNSLLKELGGRVAARYTLLLNSLADNSTDLKASWASPKYPDTSKGMSISWKKARHTVEILSKRIDELVETFEIPCRLDGIDVYKKTFDLVNLDTEERLTGRVLDSYIKIAEKMAAKVPAEYIATIEQRQELTTVTGEIKEKYSLIKLKEGRSERRS